MRIERRWEQGSEYHWMADEALLTSWGSVNHLPGHSFRPGANHPWGQEYLDFACGRDAFHSILSHGRQKRGWKRLLVPAYYCQHVVASLMRSDLEIALYPVESFRHTPSMDSLQSLAPRKGDVLLVLNFFGMARPSDYKPFSECGVEVIEDHTHDPWSDWASQSRADWCVASLRKTLPIPDGAVMWSPAGHDMPESPRVSQGRQNASAEKMAGMWLKGRYLEGSPVDKTSYLQLYAHSESTLHALDTSAMTSWSKALLQMLPIRTMRQKRNENGKTLRQLVHGIPGLSPIAPPDEEGIVPFSCVLSCVNEAAREHVRTELIKESIYPAVLWPLEQPATGRIPAHALSLSRRMLSLHCDARYSKTDMERVGEALRNAVIRAPAHFQMKQVVVDET
jgi:hypothetical protein